MRQSLIILSVPFIFSIGCLLHFIYNWSAHITIIGLFAPVNESTWEQLKMVFWPTLIWWSGGYLKNVHTNKIQPCPWFFSCAISILLGCLLTGAFYQMFTAIIGHDFFIINLLFMLVAIVLAQLSALYFYQTMKPKYSIVCFLFDFIFLFFIIIVFLYFTLDPPHLSLFVDPISGEFGM